MYIDGIPSTTNVISNQTRAGNVESTFGKFFDEAMNLFSVANDAQIEAEELKIDFIKGKSDDIIALTMANSRASTAIQFTSQITSKVLSAYKEIMSISI